MNNIVEQLRKAANQPTEAILVGSDLLIVAADEIERLRAERDRLKELNIIARTRNDDMVYVPYQLAKDIAKGWIRYDTLTQEQWDEICKWFRRHRYGSNDE